MDITVSFIVKCYLYQYMLCNSTLTESNLFFHTNYIHIYMLQNYLFAHVSVYFYSVSDLAINEKYCYFQEKYFYFRYGSRFEFNVYIWTAYDIGAYWFDRGLYFFIQGGAEMVASVISILNIFNVIPKYN